MARKKTPRTMVFDTLVCSHDEYLSIKDIRNKIFERESEYLNVETIVRAIDDINHVRGDIHETTDRRGVHKVPVKVFKLNFSSID